MLTFQFFYSLLKQIYKTALGIFARYMVCSAVFMKDYHVLYFVTKILIVQTQISRISTKTTFCLQISLDSFFDGSVLGRKSHEKSDQNQQETGKSCRKSIQIQQIQADGLIPDRQMNLSKEEEEDVQFVEQVAVIF